MDGPSGQPNRRTALPIRDFVMKRSRGKEAPTLKIPTFQPRVTRCWPDDDRAIWFDWPRKLRRFGAACLC